MDSSDSHLPLFTSHVPSVRHGSDGLLRRREQPYDKPKDNKPDDEEEFEVYGFLHFINPMIHKQCQQSRQVSAFIEEVIGNEEDGEEENKDRNDPTGKITLILDTMPNADDPIFHDDFLL